MAILPAFEMVRPPSQALPPCSQQSISDLSEPPDFNDEEYGEIIVRVSNPRPLSTSTKTSSNTDTNGAYVDLVDSHKTMPHKKGKAAIPLLQRRSNRADCHSRRALNECDDELTAAVHVPANFSNRTSSGKRRSSTDDASKDEDEDEDETYAARAPPIKKPRVTYRAKRWDPDNVTQSDKSPLVNVDLRSLLLQPSAWDCLTAEDKREILALFPKNTAVTHILDAGTPDARPNMNALLSDNNFRHDAEQYVANLSKGMHHPAWLEDAWAAHYRRAAGDFDEYYIRKIEVEWNTTIPDEYKPEHLRKQKIRGASPHVPSVEGLVKGAVNSGLLIGKTSDAPPKENSAANDDKELETNGDGAKYNTNDASEASRHGPIQGEEALSSKSIGKFLSSPIPGRSMMDAAKKAKTESSVGNLGSLSPKFPEDRTIPVAKEEARSSDTDSREVPKNAVH